MGVKGCRNVKKSVFGRIEFLKSQIITEPVLLTESHTRYCKYLRKTVVYVFEIIRVIQRRRLSRVARALKRRT